MITTGGKKYNCCKQNNYFSQTKYPPITLSGIAYNVSGIYDVFATQKCGEAQAEGAAYIPCYMSFIAYYN
jgi:hypothetical protein